MKINALHNNFQCPSFNLYQHECGRGSHLPIITIKVVRPTSIVGNCKMYVSVQATISKSPSGIERQGI